MIQNIKNIVVKNYKFKKAFRHLLKTPVFTKNPIYKVLFKQNIQKKIKKLEKYPISVIIENTNHCNISCTFCANETMNRKRGIMKRELFEEIINQCVEYNIPLIGIQGFGEPLIDKDYVSKVNYAKIKGIKSVYCVTNGILLGESISENLIKAGLDHINISIDAVNPETYGKIHRTIGTHLPSDKFNIIYENIVALVKARNLLGSKKPYIQVRFKDFELNKGELEIFTKKFSNLVDEINIYMNITNWPGSEIKNNLPNRVPIIKFPCANLWSQLNITYDGRVSLCCQDYECKVEIGDLNKESLMDVWTSDKLRHIRELHIKELYDLIPVCKKCVINSHLVSPWWS